MRDKTQINQQSERAENKTAQEHEIESEIRWGSRIVVSRVEFACCRMRLPKRDDGVCLMASK